MQSALVASWELSPVSLVESPMLGDGDRVTFLKKNNVYIIHSSTNMRIYTHMICACTSVSLSLFFSILSYLCSFCLVHT